MPLPRDPPMEIPLGGSLDQSTGKLFRGPQQLADNTNGDHDKRGVLRKSRGFDRIPLDITTTGASTEILFVTIANDDGELVLVGQETVFTVATPEPSIGGASLILRGPSLVGNYRTGVVHVTSLSE